MGTLRHSFYLILGSSGAQFWAFGNESAIPGTILYSIKAQKKKKEKEKKEKGGWRTPLSFRMPPPPPRMRRYFATTRVTVSVPRTSARLARLHAHVQHLRALNAAHFPEAEAAAEGAKRAKRAFLRRPETRD